VLHQIWSAVLASLHSDRKHPADLVVRIRWSVIRSDLDQDSTHDETDKRIDNRTISEFRQGKHYLSLLKLTYSPTSSLAFSLFTCFRNRSFTYLISIILTGAACYFLPNYLVYLHFKFFTT